MSSCIFPWCSEWTFDQLKDKEEIKAALQFAGDLARAYDQRLTFHPTHFVKLGCEEGALLDRSLHELEQHSLVIFRLKLSPCCPSQSAFSCDCLLLLDVRSNLI